MLPVDVAHEFALVNKPSDHVKWYIDACMQRLLRVVQITRSVDLDLLSLKALA